MPAPPPPPPEDLPQSGRHLAPSVLLPPQTAGLEGAEGSKESRDGGAFCCAGAVCWAGACWVTAEAALPATSPTALPMLEAMLLKEGMPMADVLRKSERRYVPRTLPLSPSVFPSFWGR